MEPHCLDWLKNKAKEANQRNPLNSSLENREPLWTLQILVVWQSIKNETSWCRIPEKKASLILGLFIWAAMSVSLPLYNRSQYHEQDQNHQEILNILRSIQNSERRSLPYNTSSEDYLRNLLKVFWAKTRSNEDLSCRTLLSTIALFCSEICGYELEMRSSTEL